MVTPHTLPSSSRVFMTLQALKVRVRSLALWAVPAEGGWKLGRHMFGMQVVEPRSAWQQAITHAQDFGCSRYRCKKNREAPCPNQ
jgi:hypothetical protein